MTNREKEIEQITTRVFRDKEDLLNVLLASSFVDEPFWEVASLIREAGIRLGLISAVSEIGNR